jgi:hypothetical protein
MVQGKGDDINSLHPPLVISDEAQSLSFNVILIPRQAVSFAHEKRCLYLHPGPFAALGLTLVATNLLFDATGVSIFCF